MRSNLFSNSNLGDELNVTVIVVCNEISNTRSNPVQSCLSHFVLIPLEKERINLFLSSYG